jgi:hypothetical protein
MLSDVYVPPPPFGMSWELARNGMGAKARSPPRSALDIYITMMMVPPVIFDRKNTTVLSPMLTKLILQENAWWATNYSAAAG